MKIQVTEEHIRKGIPKAYCDCPVALAIREQAKLRDVEVFTNCIYIKGKYIDTPKSIKDFIEKYDSYNDVEPFEFELAI